METKVLALLLHGYALLSQAIKAYKFIFKANLTNIYIWLQPKGCVNENI